jgi:sec-independent protein translocase protein TatB
MEILGVGPLEVLFIVIIALIVLGPRDLAKSARAAGRYLNRLYRSEAWRSITRASRDLRDLPNRLAREAALEDLDQTLKAAGESLQPWRPSAKGEPSRPRDDQALGPTPGGLPNSGLAEKASPTEPEADNRPAPTPSSSEAGEDGP